MSRRILTILTVALFVVSACGGEDDAEPTSSGNSADALPVTVTAKNFAFDTNSLEGHATHTVDLTFVNEDDTAHSFTIDELEVDVEAAGGQEATTTFTPDETGSFEFYCTYHSDMKGTFEVT